MAFFKKYSYIIVKLFLNQFAISLFGIGLAFASSYARNDGLLLLTSIFSVIFYLFLEYAIMWEVGAKDGITATSRHTSRGLWRGFVLSLCANAINIIAALMVFSKVFTGAENQLSAVGQFIAMVLQGMFQGILSQKVGAAQLNDFWWVYFLMILPAVLVTGMAYIIGNYGLHFTNILIPKNKDVKNNGRPK
ncbi:MAG: hypothetical protein J6U87_00075 [Clostridia bacterium]|nr:hypothetical protein [Clostridia bacterium]